MCVMCKGMYVYFNVCVHVTVMNFVNNQFTYIIHYVSFRSLVKSKYSNIFCINISQVYDNIQVISDFSKKVSY